MRGDVTHPSILVLLSDCNKRTTELELQVSFVKVLLNKDAGILKFSYYKHVSVSENSANVCVCVCVWLLVFPGR